MVLVFSLNRSPCRAFQPSNRSTLPPNFLSPVNLLRAHLLPSSRSSVDIITRTGPNTNSPFPRECHQCLAANSIHHRSLGLAVQPGYFNRMKAAPVFFQDSAVEDSVKDIAEVQADNIHILLLIITIVLHHKMLCLQKMCFRNCFFKRYKIIRQCITSWGKIRTEKHFHT